MELNREEDIRTHIETLLKQQGIAVDREVSCGNGIRADLVTSDTVIEVKKYLNRGAIYQAHGQGVVYQKHLNRPKLLIIGLAPTSEARYQEAQRIAENIRTEGVEVVFLDKDPQWSNTLLLADLSAATKAPTAKTASPKPVQLPFEKTTVEASCKSAKPDPKADSNAETRATFTPRDMWIVLLIILLFLWVRSAIEVVNQSPPVHDQPQTVPETWVPSP